MPRISSPSVWIWPALAGLALALMLAIGSTVASAQDVGPLEASPSPSREDTERRTANSLSAVSGLATSSITSTTAAGLAEAMGIQASALISSTLNGSDPQSVGVGTSPLGKHFPTEGATFAILSTGLAESADWPNLEDDLSFELGGLDNSQENDLVQLMLRLQVPADMNCASFDFAYYSEEFPEWVGSEFNDTFTAELGGTNLVISGTEVSAPLNFAFDTSGNIMSINTAFDVEPSTNTTYDGGTSLLRAQTPVDPGSVVDIVFSVQDLGDSIYDSAVFLDKFFWSNDEHCGSGAREDSDGDGLLDVWETEGLTVTVGSASVLLDLPAMGADPLRKDIFVEIDYMVAPPSCFPIVDYCLSGHSHQPKPEAMQRIVDSFANAPVQNPDGSSGINLHVDYGPDAIMNPITLQAWGARSQSNQLPHDDELGSSVAKVYSWAEFKQLKKVHFSAARAPVFHYAVFAHALGGLGSTSGMSRGIGASDFVVSLGLWESVTGTESEQAGTFMHELGHNLGLRHSGRADLLDTNFKPNYLSVMNYAFQTRGLRVSGADGVYDYSRFELGTLDEDDLDETIGLDGGADLAGYGTRYWCSLNSDATVNSVDAIDWNCDGAANDTSVQENINEGPDWNHDTRFSNLNGYDDWDHLVFTGGAIGQPGAEPDLPDETESEEITLEQDGTLATEFAVVVESSAHAVLPGGTAVYSVTVTNLGSFGDTYTITVTSDLGWAALGSVPAQLSLPPGASQDVQIGIDVPLAAARGSRDSLRLTAASQASSRVVDSWSFEVYKPFTAFLPVLLKP